MPFSTRFSTLCGLIKILVSCLDAPALGGHPFRLFFLRLKTHKIRTYASKEIESKSDPETGGEARPSSRQESPRETRGEEVGFTLQTRHQKSDAKKEGSACQEGDA
ncbi:MAG: hypothetical protein ACI8QF_003929 [Limisphaerales bacterium]|jgi:hypothetical protein